MSYQHLVSEWTVEGHKHRLYDLQALQDSRYKQLPFCIRYLLECAIRHCDGCLVNKTHVESILDWVHTQHSHVEIPFIPARVLLQDLTGVPAVVDLASMRDAVHILGGDVTNINPLCPVDMVIDHSVQVDYHGSNDALQKNLAKETERNHERFSFLKWGAKSLNNMKLIPSGSGIVHQVNLEYLSRGVMEQDGWIYPDSVVGTDSHTTMNNGSGVLSWGVGGIEAEAVMLGQPITLVLPQVIGYHLSGNLPACCTSTDLVLTITQSLRQKGVVDKFIEFYGPGVTSLSIAHRATIANMCPEYGATIAFFPIDSRTLDYLRQTARSCEQVSLLETYSKHNALFVDHSQPSTILYSEIVYLDLSTIVPCVSGPKRPHDRVELSHLHQDFTQGLCAKVSFKGFGINESLAEQQVKTQVKGQSVTLKHGSVVISAITSCTNTSNPSVMLAAGLLARNAVKAGLSMPAYVKTSLSPGSTVVSKYLDKSGLLPYLQQLGYAVTGYGCMTCIGNSGPLDSAVAQAIEQNDLVVASVVSGNRNFEGRIHSAVRANYLASPPLVVVFGLAGRVDIDLMNEPIGMNQHGKPVYLCDIWPEHSEVVALEESCVLPALYRDVYSHIHEGPPQWQLIPCISDQLYPWDMQSTYIRKVPFLDNMTKQPPGINSIKDAYTLLLLGDSVTTDHISPAGSISMNSPAARFLTSNGVLPAQFNTYGSRRGCDQVMTRGTFANIRLCNRLLNRPGPRTLHIPSGQEMDVFDAAERYKQDGHELIVIAGNDYGCGSSRDWAAKGPSLLGVRAVIAQSFERIHRSNLIGMGILPVQFLSPHNASSHNLSGHERFSIPIPINMIPRQPLTVHVDDGRSFEVECRCDTEVELGYLQHGGILPYMVRKLI